MSDCTCPLFRSEQVLDEFKTIPSVVSKKRFLPHVKLFLRNNGIENKALLLIDNTPANPSIEILKSEGITTKFLPPNTTSLIQPLDQEILESLKKRYKKFLLRHLILEDNTSQCAVPEILSKLTIKDAVYWAARAWEEASIESLAKGWNNLLIPSASSVDIIVEDIDESADFVDIFRELGNIADEQTLQYSEDWLAGDSEDDLGYQELTDEDIIAEVLNQNQTEVDPDSDVEQTQDVMPLKWSWNG